MASNSRPRVHRKRSPSPQPGPSSTSTSTSSVPSLSIKGLSKQPSTSTSTPTATSKLLHTAVTNAANSAATAAASSTSHSSSTPKSAAAGSNATTAERAQFEQQEDFISFGASPSPSPPPSHGGGRGTPRDGKRGKRTREGDELDDGEGTRKLRNREKQRSTPWCDTPGVKWDGCESSIEMLNREARAFISYISPFPHEHELRLFTIELIRRTIRSKYADADVQCFGSVGTGLYLPGGDIDLVVLCPSMPSPPLKPSSSLLHRLASLLLSSSIAEPSSLVVIAKARVPIVKFTTRFGGFAVDLSVNQKNGVEAAVRVRGMLEDFAFREEGYVEPGVEKADRKGKKKERGDSSDEEEEGEEQQEAEGDQHHVDYGVARSLVLLVKMFLSQRGMNEVFTGGLGSYSIICLVVSFLQLHPRIQTSSLNPNRNLGLLFVEFLELYGKHFNYDAAGITLRGRGGYYNKHDKGWYRPGQPYLLSIEDPNDPQNDVSGGSHAIIRVRQTFAGGFDTLTATLLHRASLLRSSKNPSSSSSSSSSAVPLKLSAASLPNADSDAPSASQQSILGSIVGMTRTGVEAREAQERLYRDGVLQRLLRRSEAHASSSSSSSKEKGKTNAGGAGDTLSKQQKKLRKEAKEREKRERTISRLARRMEEKEEKRVKRERKKLERIKGKDALAGEVGGIKGVEVGPGAGRREIESARAAAASLEGLAGSGGQTQKGEMEEEMSFVVDTVGSRPSASTAAASALHHPAPPSVEEEEEDSRYNLSSRPSTSTSLPADQHQPQPTTFTSAHSSDSDSSDAEDFAHFDAGDNGSDDEDGADDDSDGYADLGEEDVVLGGTGGDFVRMDSVSRDATREGSPEEESEGVSSEEVVESLVPRAKRAKKSPVGGAAAKEKREREEKRKAKSAFWAKKGPRE